MKRWRQITIITVCMALISCGCGQKSEPISTVEKDTSASMQIGMSFDSFVIERWIRDRDAFVKTAKELGAEVNVQNANGDVDKQISQIQYFIEKKMDAIVIISVDGSALKDVVSQAKEEGIKVISYDRLIPGVDSDLYISFDNEAVGKLMAESLKTAVPAGGEIVEIRGSKSDENVNWVMKGFESALADGNLNVVYVANCDNWEADQATGYMEKALFEHPNIVGVMCGNDDIATRVVQTLSERRMAGSVAVVGQDAELSACQRIMEGTQTMTVYKQVEDMAKIAARMCVDLIQGKKLSSEKLTYSTTDTINDGSYEVPYYKLDPVAVTDKNMDNAIIDSGFHERSDVYLNVSES